MDGAEMIAAERRRQVEAEGWTPEHDALHEYGDLARAAVCYIERADPSKRYQGVVPLDWPWDDEWWKPSDDMARNLVKAGALIAAELDRLQRRGR